MHAMRVIRSIPNHMLGLARTGTGTGEQELSRQGLGEETRIRQTVAGVSRDRGWDKSTKVGQNTGWYRRTSDEEDRSWDGEQGLARTGAGTGEQVMRRIGAGTG